MKKFIACFLSFAIIFSLVGCASSRQEATTKANKDTLNVFLASEPDHLDPILTSTADGASLALNSFEGLYRYNEKSEPEPACAESYTLSKDKKTYVFKLRDSLKWSNGEKLDAHDFEYSWKRAADVESAATYSNFFSVFGDRYDEEKGLTDDAVVASEDGTTLTVRLGMVCPYFFELLSNTIFLPVYKESVEKTRTDYVPTGTWANDAGEDFVCNGAFALKEWRHDSVIVYEKNEYYWDADSVSIKTLNYMLTSNGSSAYVAYQTGDLDYTNTIPTDEYQQAKKSDDFQIMEQLGTYYFEFNYSSPLYKKIGLNEEEAKVFRHAVCLLIDRKYIVDNICQANQSLANTFVPLAASDGNGGGFYDEFDGYFNTGETTEEYEANVEEAKKLLTSIGLWDKDTQSLTKNVSFTYLTNNATDNVRIAEAVQSDLSKVGINMTIDQQDWNVFIESRRNGDFDVARAGYYMDYSDPISMLEIVMTKSSNNDCQFGKDKSKSLDWSKYDDKIDEIRMETDTKKRAELMHEAENMLMDTWCIIPLYYYNSSQMAKKYVNGIYTTVLGIKYFYKATIS